MNDDGVGRDEQLREHPGAAPPASRGHTSAPARQQQPGDDHRGRTLDRLADGDSCRLGSVYYGASCPACGQQAVWHDQAVGRLPGLIEVCTTSEVVCCTTCDGAGP